MAEYKNVQFVNVYASQATSLAGSVYTKARAFVPSFAEPFVQQLEETACNISAPYVTKAQDTAEKLLATVDGQVEYFRDLHNKNVKTFNDARSSALNLVESTVNQAKSVLDPTPYVQYASDKVAYYADPDKILDTSFEVAGKVATFGPVPKVLETADPLIKTYVKAYDSVHDTVVSLPVYKKLWDVVISTSNTLQDSWVYKKFLELGYPVLAPVADPVYSNITNSKYLKAAVSHLEPAKQL